MWPKYPNAEARNAGTRKAPSTLPQPMRPAGEPFTACGPSPSRQTMAPAVSARPEAASIWVCQAREPPQARIRWGKAVPMASMPTSQPSISPARCGAQPTTSFMPIG